jgi:hypothetical protein
VRKPKPNGSKASTVGPLVLSFVGGEGAIRFGPLTKGEAFGKDPYDFVHGPITIERFEHEPVVLERKNGIDALRLAFLRGSLLHVADQETWRIWFGDHDFSMLVALSCEEGGGVRIDLDFPLDKIDWHLGLCSTEDFPRIIDEISAIEAAFGPLTGACQACGVPTPEFLQDN